MTVQEQARPGDLLLYSVTPKSGVVSRLIATVELWRKEGDYKTQYSHVSVVSSKQDYQFEAMFPKTRESQIDWTDPRIELWRVKDSTSDQVTQVLSWCRAHVNCYYDVGQVFMGFFRLSNTYSCTKFARQSWLDAGRDIVPGAGKFIGPNDLVNPTIERVA